MNRVLSPCYIGNCRIENRFVMTAGNLGWCPDGYVTQQVIDFYKERAKGQVGLIIVGAAGVDPYRVNQVGMMQIYKDEYICNLEKLTAEIHKYGSKVFVQLMHAGAYAKRKEHDMIPAVAPSDYYCNFTREDVYQLSKEEIHKIVGYFGDAARRAQKAGFDGVEIIGSAGYLISEFLSKATNKREDEYGGTIENRVRFLLEIVEDIRKKTDEKFPIMVRLSGADFVPNGNDPEEVVAIGKMIHTKIDAIDVTGGWHESQVPQITYNVPHGMFLYLAKALKQNVSVPVIGCNRLDIRKIIEAVEHDYCDMGGMLRGLIADSQIVKKYKNGFIKNIRPCLACNQECLEKIFSGEKLGCVVNPIVGREGEEFRWKDEKKKILVIGAGISGMTYATLMAKKNRVTIWEKSLNYGGAGNILAHIPDRQDVQEYMDYVFRRCIISGVSFKWHKEATKSEIEQLILKKRFDKVVIAAGSRMEEHSYKATSDAPIISLEECILNKYPKGKNIVIIGSGYKAVQVAQYCVETGKNGAQEMQFLNKYAPDYLSFANNIMDWGQNKVTILHSKEHVGNGFGKSTRWMMLKEIKKAGVVVENRAEIKLIDKDKIHYIQDGMEKKMEADMVIICEGWKADSQFVFESKEIAGKIEYIGDAKRPGRISEAVNDAFETAFI